MIKNNNEAYFESTQCVTSLNTYFKQNPEQYRLFEKTVKDNVMEGVKFIKRINNNIHIVLVKYYCNKVRNNVN